MTKQIGVDNIRLTTSDEIPSDILYTCEKDIIKYIGCNNPNKIPTISVTLPSLLYGNNEKNLGKELYLKAVEEARVRFSNMGLDLDDMRISYIEFNYNSTDISLYNTLELIERATLHDSVKVMETKTINGIQSMKIKKSTYSIKIYKKSEQLRETGQGLPKEELLRFEATTDHTTTLDRLVPNRSVTDIYDNWDNIIKWYKKCMQKGLQSPVDRYIRATTLRLTQLMDNGKKPSRAVGEVLLDNDLVDTSIIDNAVKQHYKNTGKSSPYKLIKNIHKSIKSMNIRRYNMMTGNLEKLNKLYEDIGI